VAETVAGELRGMGFHVVEAALQDAPDPAGFSAVVVGAPIRYDRWHRPMRDYVARHGDALAGKPCAAFFTCLTLSRRTPEALNQASEYARRVAFSFPGLDPDSVGRFGGVLDYGRFPIPLRWAAWAMMSAIGVTQGDYRNWDEIRSWARAVGERFDEDRVIFRQNHERRYA